MILDKQKVRIKMVEARIEHYSDLARRADISETTLRTTLGTNKWRAQTVESIATALQCSPLALITVLESR